jgi:hypothetical protein
MYSGQIGQLLDDCVRGLCISGQRCVARAIDDDGVDVCLGCSIGLYRRVESARLKSPESLGSMVNERGRRG